MGEHFSVLSEEGRFERQLADRLATRSGVSRATLSRLLRLSLQGQVFELSAGDSLSYRSVGRSVFANPGTGPSRYLLAMTVPTL